MSEYEFDLIKYTKQGKIENKDVFRKRPFTKFKDTFEENAKDFFPGNDLETAINTAIAVGAPLLLTGEPGTGKTQTAYYVAYKSDLPIFHFQVKSDSTAHDLLYNFNAVEYFHEASISKDPETIDKNKFVEPGPFMKAIDLSNETNLPCIILIDEIDKAPRDFPNDLLLELDKMEFEIKETGEPKRTKRELRPIVFITSNSERRLPEPFLRRCVYHNIKLKRDLVLEAVRRKCEKAYPNMKDHLEVAVDKLWDLRKKIRRKKPSTGELMVWLNVISLQYKNPEKILKKRLSELPCLGVLIKDRNDLEEIVGVQ